MAPGAMWPSVTAPQVQVTPATRWQGPLVTGYTCNQVAGATCNKVVGPISRTFKHKDLVTTIFIKKITITVFNFSVKNRCHKKTPL